MRAVAAVLVLGVVMLVTSGCHLDAREDVGQAVVALTEVPSDVACVRITVAGSRTVARAFDVAAGQSSVLALDGLPIGEDTFTAEAFGVACAAVGAATVPTWAGDSVTATISAGATTAVSITLHRNGRATVSVDFSDNPDASAPLGNGSPCTAAAGCQSGFCVDGVCCDTACAGTCVSCAGAGLAGRCAPVPAGAADPRGGCRAEPPQTCGMTGVCNGSGACALAPPGTICAPPVCAGSVLINAGVCSAAGVCIMGPTMSCVPFVCSAAGGRCATSCAANADCARPFVCNAGLCGLAPAGAACATGAECATGICAQGVCCTSSCGGTCMSCALPGSAGVCAPAPAGTDPLSSCTDSGPASCGTDGSCDGNGACRLYARGTLCAAGSCVGTTATSAQICDGDGTCLPPVVASCAPFTCAGGGTCRSSCAVDTDCIAGGFCQAGVCLPLAPNGAACSANAQCVSGICAAGVCRATP